MIHESLFRDLSLWGCLWQSMAFIIFGLVVSHLLRRHPSRAYQVLFIAMIAAVMVPLMSAWVRHYDLGFFTTGSTESSSILTEEPDSLPLAGANNLVHINVPVAVSQVNINSEPTDITFTSNTISWHTLATRGWAMSTLALLARLIITFIYGAYIVRKAKWSECEQVQQAVDDVTLKLGLSCRLQARSSTLIRSPIVWCWSRPSILLVPSAYNDQRVNWSGVVAHELAHCKRSDHITGLIAELMVCLLPWNLLMWLSKKCLIRFGEQACDDWVIAAGQASEDYAESLLRFRPQKQMAFLPAVVHSKKGLAGRIDRILSDNCGNPRTGVMWALAVSIVVACLSIGIAFAQTRPSRSNDGPEGHSKIVFVSNKHGKPDLYIMNPDGSEQKRLTNDPDIETNPCWSPDGRRIAFSSRNEGEKKSIHVINADGSGKRNLTDNSSSDDNPIWSPDGRKIVFSSQRGGTQQLYIMNVDGSEQKRLTNNSAGERQPCWSPDGKEIVFTMKRGEDYEIYVINTDGRDQRRLTHNPTWDGRSSWSPDGRKIAFNSYRDGNQEIYVMNEDGSHQTRLTYNSAPDRNPYWSPDGKKIVFASTRDDDWETYSSRDVDWEIYVMNADGSQQERVTSNPGPDRFPCWSPFLSERTYSIHQRSADSDIEQVKSPASANVNVRNRYDIRPLLEAAWRGDAETIKLLIEKGFNVNATQGTNSWTPLHCASYQGHVDIVKFLIEKGANVIAGQGTNSWMPLHCASDKGHMDIVKILVANGAIVDAGSWTPLHLAVKNGHKEVAKMLIVMGADINMKGGTFGIPPIQYAADYIHKEVVDILLRAGADINAKDNRELTALHNLAWHGQQDAIHMMDFLLSRGADIEAKNKWSTTPLFFAVQSGKLESAQFLLNKGATIKVTDNNGKTLLSLAKEKGHTKIIELLLKHNI